MTYGSSGSPASNRGASRATKKPKRSRTAPKAPTRGSSNSMQTPLLAQIMHGGKPRG